SLSDPHSPISDHHYMTNCFTFRASATSEIYTLSLHDALPILFETGRGCGVAKHSVRRNSAQLCGNRPHCRAARSAYRKNFLRKADRKSTRLNSSHVSISYAVFCLKKKNYPYIDILPH